MKKCWKIFVESVQYVIGGDAESGKSIKQLYGSQRKVEDQKVRAKKGEINRLVWRVHKNKSATQLK